jgi:hypothetical protein
MKLRSSLQQGHEHSVVVDVRVVDVVVDTVVRVVDVLVAVVVVVMLVAVLVAWRN